MADGKTPRGRTRHRRGVWIAASIIVAFGLAGAVFIAVTSRRGDSTPQNSPGIDHPPAALAVGADTAPPWPAPADASAAVAAAGLPMLTAEGTVEHIHVHLDVLVDGHPVSVPADIGIDRNRGRISSLHTHDSSGVIHIESPTKREFSLGEFFSEWQVSLTSDNIGGLHSGDGKVLRVFVNGTPRPGNPAAITFAAHDEIAIVYGTPQPGETPPASYTFPPGD